MLLTRATEGQEPEPEQEDEDRNLLNCCPLALNFYDKTMHACFILHLLETASPRYFSGTPSIHRKAIGTNQPS